MSVLAACGSSGPTSVTLHAGDARAVAVELDGAWQALAPNEATTIEVDGPYAVASLCDVDVSTQSETWLLGPGDGDEHWLPCQRTAAPVSVEITFPGVAPGDDTTPRPEAYLGTTYLGDRADIVPGTYDLVAFENVAPFRYVIQRGVAIEAATTLTVDFAADGAPLAERDLRITGVDPSENISIEVAAEIGDTVALLNGNSTPVQVLPDDALAAGDRQLVQVFSYDGDVWSRVILGDGVPDLRMPPAITTSELDLVDAPSATWETSGHYDRALLSMVANGGSYDRTLAYPGWFEATGSSGALTGVDLATMPGWDPAWRITPASAALSLSHERADGTGEGAHAIVYLE